MMLVIHHYHTEKGRSVWVALFLIFVLSQVLDLGLSLEEICSEPRRGFFLIAVAIMTGFASQYMNTCR